MTDDFNKFLDKSVTVDDQGRVDREGVLRVVVPLAAYGYDQIALPPAPPAWWQPQRDLVLRATVHHEAMWAGAIGIALTKAASTAWEITSEVPKRQEKAQEILLLADGSHVGWVRFIMKHVRDFLTTDNGAFVEIVRSGSRRTDSVIGLRHLDSARCLRTGDPDVPVIFRDRYGKVHKLESHQVFMVSDMPDPSESYFDVGTCAASRAYKAIYKLAQIEWYLAEKVSGKTPLAIHIVNGILDTQLKNAVDAARQEQVSRGVLAYMGAVIIGVPQQTPPDLVTIPLAELPDRFNRKEEFDIAVLTYANALGLDVQDLQPLTGQNLGTGAQSNVLADKAMGKGIIAWRQMFTHCLNQFVLDDQTSFEFMERDYRDIKQKEEISSMRVQTAQQRIAAGLTNAQQELTLMVKDDELPNEFLPAGATTEVAPLSDTDKPEDLQQPGSPGALEKLSSSGMPMSNRAAQLRNALMRKKVNRPEQLKLAMESRAAQTQAGQEKKKKANRPGPSKEALRKTMLAKVQRKEFDSYAEAMRLIEIQESLVETWNAEENPSESFFSLKHLAGRHPQKRHGWRYGSLDAARRSMRRQTDPDERAEYRRRAGMATDLEKISRPPTPPRRTGADVRKAIFSYNFMDEYANAVIARDEDSAERDKLAARYKYLKNRLKREQMESREFREMSRRWRDEEYELDKKYPWKDRNLNEAEYLSDYKKAHSELYARQREELEQFKNNPQNPSWARMAAEMREIDERKKELWGKYTNHDAVAKKYEDEVKKAVLQAVMTDKPTDVRIISNITDSRFTSIREALNIFNQIVSRDAVPITSLTGRKGGRGRASMGDVMNITTGSGPVTVLHELGHWIEDHSPRIRAAVMEFYNRRTKKDSLVSMNSATKSRSYKSHEKTKVDKFFDPYMGAFYFWNGKQIATEITSMWFSKLMYDPIGFIKADPEHFDLVYDLLQGSSPSWFKADLWEKLDPWSDGSLGPW